MKVSELARRTGVSIHRLRRYEAQGLIQAERSASGYREFNERAIREVVFISMARDLGFSLDALAESLPRYRAGTLTHDEVIGDMLRRIAEVDAEIDTQRALRKRLVEHVAWLERRKAEAAARKKASGAAAWPAPVKKRA